MLKTTFLDPSAIFIEENSRGKGHDAAVASDLALHRSATERSPSVAVERNEREQAFKGA
jgi:hypothetical protein